VLSAVAEAGDAAMYISADTLDDLLHEVFGRLLKGKDRIRPSKGPATELCGVLLKIRNPRARLSRTETKGFVFSSIGETLWYFARSNALEFIKYYLSNYAEFSDDGRTVYGAYGPRLFRLNRKVNQVSNVVSILRRKPDTRQAVVQLFDGEDIVKEHKDVPCTCSIQFLLRKNRLHVLTSMRSNDVYLGLPHDIFAFTFLQEVVARSIGAELGTYKHAVSLHLYDRDRAKTVAFLKEGFQSRKPMPAMPPGDPWPNLSKLLVAEKQIRLGRKYPSPLSLPSYWADLVRLLQIYASTGNGRAIREIQSQMASKVFDVYIERRARVRKRRGQHSAAG